MAVLKKYDLLGKEVGSVDVDEALAEATANGQMIKDYIVALRNNARQWSANTKGRSEVNHSTKKPHPQKGGGRARQGSLAAPQYKGGGRVFTPKPKFDQHVRINRKERKAAVRFLLAEKIKSGKIVLVSDFNLTAPKTKSVVQFIKQCDLKGRILFLGEGSFQAEKQKSGNEQQNNFAKSVRNLPKVEFGLASNLSGYDVIVAHHIVMTQSAFEELNHHLLK